MVSETLQDISPGHCGFLNLRWEVRCSSNRSAFICYLFFFQLYLLMFYLFYKVSVYYVAEEFSFQVNVCGVLKGSCTFICISFFRLGKSSFCWKHFLGLWVGILPLHVFPLQDSLSLFSLLFLFLHSGPAQFDLFPSLVFLFIFQGFINFLPKGSNHLSI